MGENGLWDCRDHRALDFEGFQVFRGFRIVRVLGIGVRVLGLGV